MCRSFVRVGSKRFLVIIFLLYKMFELECRFSLRLILFQFIVEKTISQLYMKYLIQRSRAMEFASMENV